MTSYPLQIFVSGRKTAHANQKWFPCGISSELRPGERPLDPSLLERAERHGPRLAVLVQGNDALHARQLVGRLSPEGPLHRTVPGVVALVGIDAVAVTVARIPRVLREDERLGELLFDVAPPHHRRRYEGELLARMLPNHPLPGRLLPPRLRLAVVHDQVPVPQPTGRAEEEILEATIEGEVVLQSGQYVTVIGSPPTTSFTISCQIRIWIG